MRRMLFVAAVALLGFAGSGLAQGQGTIVKWNNVAGLQGWEGDSPNLIVGDMSPMAWVYVNGGKVLLNVDTGEVQIQIRHISWAWNNPNTAHPMGSVLGGAPFERRGTFVCYAEDRINVAPQKTQTDVIYLDDTGSVNYHGKIDVQPLCHDYPDQIVFVFGGINRYFAFGVARQVIGSK